MTNTKNSPNTDSHPEFLKGLSDLALATMGESVWLESVEVRHAWYAFFTSWVISIIMLFFGKVAFAGAIRFSPLYTEIFRIFRTVCWVFVLVCLIWLGYQFYKQLLMTGRDLRFSSISFFIAMEIILFGLIYNSLYFLDPQLFTYQSPPIIPTETFMDLGLPTIISSLEFLLYSACINISITYPKIMSNSSLVSIINFFQVLIWLALMGLFIATFVQLAATRKNDSVS